MNNKAEDTVSQIKSIVGDHPVYLTFDIDCLDPAYAPGTGSSSPTGMIPRELFPKLREFAATKTIVGFDIVEFNPFYFSRRDN